jgi:hypothetical protein
MTEKHDQPPGDRERNSDSNDDPCRPCEARGCSPPARAQATLVRSSAGAQLPVNAVYESDARFDSGRFGDEGSLEFLVELLVAQHND